MGRMKKAEGAALIAVLEARFVSNEHRHEGIVWHDVRSRLEWARCVAKLEGQNPMCDSGLKYLSTELYRTG